MGLSLTFPEKLRATITLPGSKSIAARALILSALSGGRQVLNLSDCDDTQALLKALTHDTEIVDIGAAGTAMRFLTAYFATQSGTQHLLTGTERMQQRPISILVEALQTLGADITYTGQVGYPPLLIKGKDIQGGEVRLSAEVSSQYISALLMVGPMLRDGLRLQLEGPIASRPYIEMTLGLMREFGAKASWTDAKTICVAPGGYSRTAEFVVEPDWSAASYWYEMVALSNDAEAEIQLPYLRAESLQGDSVVKDLFHHLGVDTRFDSEGATLTKKAFSPTSTTWEVDFSQFPDLAQTFVATCAILGQPFHFTGLQSLRIKETDRIAALVAELGKLGIMLEAEASSIAYQPQQQKSAALAQPEIATYEDHRMAMCIAPCAMRQPGIKILHPEVVNKSYPTFWEDLQRVGVILQ